ncbi:MAG TPA: hypothetical protein VFR36_07060 [Sphingomicrobium sp.]|nr:hypothetical protein [Sphingomicrobium sp.]
MYQSLISWVVMRNRVRDHSRGVAPPLYAKLLERASDTLVDGVGADGQLGCDLLAAVMPVDQQQAMDLAIRKPGHGRIRMERSAWLFDAIRHHQVHQHSFRAWNLCWNKIPLRFP